MATHVRTERPVVLIGAGGTGKQTLLYLRRMLFERYGVKSLPWVAQVVIDTDGAEKHLDGREFDEFDQEIAFEDEMLVTPVGDALKNIRENRSHYPHIDAWLDPALERHGDITDGAGQIRSFGRLAFFHHFGRINKHLEAAYRKVTDGKAVKAALENHNVKLDTSAGVDTWLVFSVAGGTGAGMFLDLAFLAKRLSRMVGGGQVRSIILLPTAFTSNLPLSHSSHRDHRPFANAYASLMELETYNFQRREGRDSRIDSSYPAQWTRELYDQKHHEVGPVFANSWLIDNEALEGGGKMNGERMALCQMMAEWLFLQYGATAFALSDAIRSNRSNDTNDFVPLAEVNITHRQPARSPASAAAGDETHEVTLLFSKRYSSFGLSKIYIPTTNIASQAYARLVGDIAGLWLEPPRAGDPRRSLDRIGSKVHMPPNAAVVGFTQGLARELSLNNARQPLSLTFERMIQDKLQELKGRGLQPGAETEARDWFSREILSKLLDGASAATRRGEISRVIQPENVRLVREQVKRELDEFVSDTLKVPGERLGHAEQALRYLVNDYKQLAEQANERATREEATGRRLQQEIEDLLVWASEHRGFDRSTIFEAAFSKMRDRASAEFRRQVLVASAVVAVELADHIGVGRTVRDEDGKERQVDTGMLQTLSELRETLQTLKQRAAERIQALRGQPSSPLNSRAPATEQDKVAGSEAELDQIYQDVDGRPIEQDTLEKYEEQLYVDLAHSGFVSPWHLRGPADARRVDKAFKQMLKFAGAQLSHLPNRMEDAILHFRRQFSRAGVSGQYEAKLNDVVSHGSPWLPRYAHHVANDDFKERQVTYYLACSEKADQEARADLLEKVRGRQVVSGPLDTVYFEGEVAGVPLFAIRHMTYYRNAYIGYQGAADPATRIIHTELDHEKYVDLLPYTSEEMALRSRAVRAFVQGIVAGVVVPVSAVNSGAVEWQFLEQTRMSARPVFRWLGRYRTAVETLAQPEAPLWSSLMREIEAKYRNVPPEDLGKLYYAVEEMLHNPPVAGVEWSSAAASVLADMRRKEGDAIEQQARDAEKDRESWGDAVKSTGEHPFWRVKALVPPARPG